jgi:hypothetical protein
MCAIDDDAQPFSDLPGPRCAWRIQRIAPDVDLLGTTESDRPREHRRLLSRRPHTRFNVIGQLVSVSVEQLDTSLRSNYDAEIITPRSPRMQRSLLRRPAW